MDDDAVERCPECGAPLPPAGTCRENFHALLLLESEVPGGPGNMPHFYAVATYGIQHPDSMRFTAETVEGLREGVSLALAGEASIEQLRQRAREVSKRQGRVTRREGDAVPGWCVREWTMTVADVLAGGVEGYAERVERWARAVIDDLEACE